MTLDFGKKYVVDCGRKPYLLLLVLLCSLFLLPAKPAEAIDVKKGDTVTDGTFTYIILTKATKKKDGTVAVYGLNKNVFDDEDNDTSNDSPETLEIPARIKYDNTYYDITATGSSGKATISGTSSSYQYYWGNARKITLPDSVTLIGDNSFAKAEYLKKINVPSGVTAIGGEAFSGTKIKAVEIPAATESIGRAAFWECEKLETVSFGEGLRIIGKWAFQQSGIKKAVLPEGLLEIRQAAFSKCTSLKQAGIPSTTKKLGAGVFSGCDSLKKVSVSKENTEYTSEKQIIYSADGTVLVDGGGASGAVVIADGTQRIAKCAFESNKKIKSVTIPDTVEIIKDGAFLSCTKLKSAGIGNNVTKLGASSFAQCTKLKQIILPESVKQIGKNAFYQCTNAETLTMGGQVAFIGSRAFAECELLLSVSIPGTVKEIGDAAFCRNSRMTTVELAEGTAYIGEQAFAWCALSAITLPQSIVSIGAAAFQGNSRLEEVMIPASVTEISDNVFASCRNLTDLQVSEENQVYRAGNGALYNKNGTKLIAWPSAEGDLVLPEGITTIGSYAFQSTQVNSVILPSSVLKIEQGAFASCTELLWVKFEGNEMLLPSETEDENGASTAIFYGCFALQTVSAPQIDEDDQLQTIFAKRLKAHMDNNGTLAWLQGS